MNLTSLSKNLSSFVNTPPAKDWGASGYSLMLDRLAVWPILIPHGSHHLVLVVFGSWYIPATFRPSHYRSSPPSIPLPILAIQGLFVTKQCEVVVVSHQLLVQFFHELPSQQMAVGLEPMTQPSLSLLEFLPCRSLHDSQVSSPVFCQQYISNPRKAKRHLSPG